MKVSLPMRVLFRSKSVRYSAQVWRSKSWPSRTVMLSELRDSVRLEIDIAFVMCYPGGGYVE